MINAATNTAMTKSNYNAGAHAETAYRPQSALTKSQRKGIMGKDEVYAPRVRSPGEVLPPTFAKGGTYVPGDGDVKHAYRAGAFDHLKYKSLGIGV